MSEGKPDKTREDVRTPTGTGEAPVRLGAPVVTQQVSESRRRFAKAGLLASPILMSVASRPVFGAPCLSNILSGNLSDPDRGQCRPGDSPETWKSNPGSWPKGVSPGGFMVGGNSTDPKDCSECVDAGTVEIGEREIAGKNNNKLKLALTNYRKQDVYITWVKVTWPTGAKKLKKMKLNEDFVKDIDFTEGTPIEVPYDKAFESGKDGEDGAEKRMRHFHFLAGRVRKWK